MGTPEFSVPSLAALLTSEHSVAGVVTQPDRPKGRGQELAASPVKQLALQHTIPILQPAKMKDPAFLNTLSAWKPDLIAVTAFGRILPKVVLDLPPHGCINVHASLLPKYRGLNTHRRVLEAGDRVHGASVHFVTAELDGGPVILQSRVAVRPGDTEDAVSARVQATEHIIYPRVIGWLADGRLAWREGRPWLDGKPLAAPVVEDFP